jgi:hypothetical protein
MGEYWMLEFPRYLGLGTMIKKADTVAKRWDDLVSSGVGKELATSLQEFEEKIDTEVSKEKIDIADVIATLRDSVGPTIVPFSLNPSKITDRAVITAFDKAGLDSKNPIHWNFLVYLFALAHFGKLRGRGRPPEWKGERYTQLQRDFDEIRNEKPTIASIEVCRALKKRHAGRYKLSAERLDKEVKRAYDPRYNPDIAVFTWVMLKAVGEAHIKRGLAWGPDVEAETLKGIITSLRKRKERQKTSRASAETASVKN